MEILSRQELSSGKIFVNLVLTTEEVKKLIAGRVVNGEEPELATGIVMTIHITPKC